MRARCVVGAGDGDGKPRPGERREEHLFGWQHEEGECCATLDEGRREKGMIAATTG